MFTSSRKKFLILFLLLYSFWIILSLPENVFSKTGVNDILQHLIAGIFISIFVTIIFYEKFLKAEELYVFKIESLYRFFKYCIRLLWDIVLAGIDVANRVLRINMLISPAIVEVKTPLKDDCTITINANSITLTPGTITLDVKKEDGGCIFWVHCISNEAADSILKDKGFIERIQKIYK